MASVRIHVGEQLYKEWKKAWEEANKRPFEGNVNSASWSLRRIAQDIGLDRTRAAMEYYFRVNKVGHDLQWFLYHYDELLKHMQALEEDARHREILRKQTRERMEQLDELRSSADSGDNQGQQPEDTVRG